METNLTGVDRITKDLEAVYHRLIPFEGAPYKEMLEVLPLKKHGGLVGISHLTRHL